MVMAKAGVGEAAFRAEIRTPPHRNPIPPSPFLHFNYNHSLFQSDSQREDKSIASMEEETAVLEKELRKKEKDTFEVLKELQAAKLIVESLKSRVSIAESEIIPDVEVAIAPVRILTELKQAKVNLSKTRTDLAGIRASVESYKRKVEIERACLEETRAKLSSNCSKNSSHRNVADELHRLREVGETAKARVARVMSEINKTKAEAELIEEKLKRKDVSDMITLTYEEYALLARRPEEADEKSRKRVGDAFLELDKAIRSKMVVSRRTDEAMEAAEASKKALEDALNRVAEAERGKVAAEEMLRKSRCERRERRKYVRCSAKFKVSGPSDMRRDLQMRDLNGMDVVKEDWVPAPALKSSLSIRQILSKKLPVAEEIELVAEEFELRKPKVSLGQMLAKHSGELSCTRELMGKENDGRSMNAAGSSSRKLTTKRKKFGLARISVMLAKQSGKKNDRKSPMKAASC